MPDQVTSLFTAWMKRLGEVMQKELRLDQQGFYTVEFEGDLRINLTASETTGALQIYAGICPFPEDISDQALALQNSLRFNLEQAESLQGSLCLAPDERSVLLCFSRPVEALDEVRFVDTFLRFYDACVEARAILQPDVQAST